MIQEQQQGITEEEKELILIEELSQKLEGLYKDMEQIRRENLLFESYIMRNSKDLQREEEAEDKKQKTKKKDKPIDKKTMQLTNEEKYEIAQFESDTLKKNIEEGRIRSDQILETLRAILEETDKAITEIRKDAFDFQREILFAGENTRTGKIEAERIEKYFKEKLAQKDAQIEKYKQKKANIEQQITKTSNQIQKKEEMGDDLKFIDFHQLQIENKKYVKQIDEKNKKLLGLKIATGKISSILIEERNQLQNEIDQCNKLIQEIDDKNKKIAKTQEQIKKVKRQIASLTEKKKKFAIQLEQVNNATNEDIPKAMTYVLQKRKEEELVYKIRNTNRKIEIAELAYQKACKALGINPEKL
ncbi:unnamed protein product [Paramecium primaurelia]|uniref:Cilia- and flagella-associated protein 263 n=2 Tax=Paramecium TaxID=5884 RepID=A0A8S1UR38_9CILI|nr:unnamed protein product [Paramecium primaurelia]CAD8164926.1 unnamed protein product [Paramecium pentaurelia]